MTRFQGWDFAAYCPDATVETPDHVHLKVGAVRWLFRMGCSAAAAEVVCPIARHRVDVAGYLDPLPRSRRSGSNSMVASHAAFVRGAIPRTVIVECKQSRADFLRDGPRLRSLVRRREHLNEVRRALEERILKVCEPELRRSDTALFPELEDWDFAGSRLESYRAIVHELAALDRRIHGSAKFFLLAHYRLADALWLAAPTGMLNPSDVPAGWGLVEVDRACVCSPASDAWQIRVDPPQLSGRATHRRRLLRNIAVALTRQLFRTATWPTVPTDPSARSPGSAPTEPSSSCAASTNGR